MANYLHLFRTEKEKKRAGRRKKREKENTKQHTNWYAMALFFETVIFVPVKCTQTLLRNFDLITTDVHLFEAWEVRITLGRENSCT